MKSFRRIGAWLGLFFFFSLALSSAQEFYFPYYGKNKVIYGKFDWRSYKTDHFEIYFYLENIPMLKNIAGAAESAYQKISQTLKHQLSRPVPLIYYTTFTDFEQTNLFQISEGVLGVSEPVLHRIGLHGDMPLDDLQSLIEHELTHVFQFDILWGSSGAALYAVSQPPLWVFEGLSEYVTQKWSPWSSLIVRDAILNDRLPEFSESGELFSRYPLPREPAYDFGHAIYEFISWKFGDNAINELWQSLKNSPLLGKRDPLQRAFKIKQKDFGYELKKFLRGRTKDFLMRENPEDYSIPLGPEYPMNPYYFAFSHALSPSGEIVATLTYNAREGEVDIVLLSAKDGSIIKNITKGFTSKYEYIKYEIDPSRGTNLAWSPEGDRIAFWARDGNKYSLFLVNVLTGKTIQKFKLPLDQPNCPCFYPDGQKILFTAYTQGIHDIFRLDLRTGEFANLTNDMLYEKAPAISPDGRTVAYSIRLDSVDKLFLSPLDNLSEKTQLTFGQGNTIAPQFSADSQTIFFSGDSRDAYNIYSLNLQTGELRRFTDVRTGNFFPSPIPGNSKEFVFSSFNKSAFQLFKSDSLGQAEATLAFSKISPEKEFKQFEPLVALDIEEEKIAPYKGIGKLYLTSRPPIDAVVSTDGSIYGGSAISFSDLMGDHNFVILAYQVRSFRSYYFSYLNQKKRLQWLASAFQYTEFYYPPYAYYDPSLYRYMTYQDAIATRKLLGINLAGYYPLNKFYRAEGALGFWQYEEDFLDPATLRYLGENRYSYFLNGNILSASFSLVGETTRFNYSYGPQSGHTFRLSLSQALPVSRSFLRNTTLEADLRQYLHLGGDFLIALRWHGFASLGRDPYIFYFGGNNSVRSAEYYNIIANQGWYANAELRFPLINIALTIIGQIGPVRGAVFFDIAQAKTKGYPAKFYRYSFDLDTPLIDEFDAIGSFGYGIQFFFLGLPLHLEFVKRLEFPSISNPFRFQTYGDFQTKFWIGFDF